MKNVLFVTYYWPPAGGVMMNRIFRFYENLREFGWNPIILTVQEGDFPIYDSNLFSEIVENTIVYKAKNIRLQKTSKPSSSTQTALYSFTDKTDTSIKSRILKFIKFNFVPDTRILWSLFAVKEALKIVNSHCIDLIFSSSPPQTNHIIARQIKRKTGIPWVADLRDPWSDVFWMNQGSIRLNWIDKLDKKIEKQTLSYADTLVTVTPQLKEKYEGKYGKCHLVLNGYTDKYYHEKKIEKTDYKFYTIVYSGSMSYDQKPDMLFDLLNNLKKQHPDHASKLRVKFIGAFPPFLSSMIKSQNLQEMCAIEDHLPMNQVADRLYSADMLFLTGVPNCDYGIIPSKMYDYIATRKIIFGNHLDKDAIMILQQSGLGQSFSFGEEKSAFDYLLSNMDGEIKVIPNEEFIQSLSRRNQTQQLAQIFDDVWNRRNH